MFRRRSRLWTENGHLLSAGQAWVDQLRQLQKRQSPGASIRPLQNYCEMPPSRDGYGTIRAPLICTRCGDDIDKVANLAQRSPRYKGKRLASSPKDATSPKSINWPFFMKLVGYSTVFTAFAVLAFGLTSSSEAAKLPPVNSVKTYPAPCHEAKLIRFVGETTVSDRRKRIGGKGRDSAGLCL